MIKLTDKQIKDIAENLGAGLRCFYHKKTGELKTVLNLDSWMGADEELWEEDLKEIEDNWDDYVEFEAMESRDAFIVMNDFIDTVEDQDFQERLTQAINRRKPFRNFMDLIDSGDYRQKWFDFKALQDIKWVKEQLDSINRESLE
jgi:hypothetical protein